MGILDITLVGMDDQNIAMGINISWNMLQDVERYYLQYYV